MPMNSYPLDLIPPRPEQTAPEPAKWLLRRPFSEHDRSFEEDARHFVAGEALATAMNAALAVGEPLLLTGEPGTGKTQAAYYAAHKLNTRLFHFQVKSDSTARDLLYHFNTVQYFHDAHLQQVSGDQGTLDKGRYVEPRTLWEAFDYGTRENRPAVVLIDEIDKATRDFPNDLLHELDKMEFKVVETGEKVKPDQSLRPILFITSNSERRLPEPFLRRCVYHHIRFDKAILDQAIAAHHEEFEGLQDDLLQLAVKRFLALRGRQQLRKVPATGELLVWLRLLALALDTQPKELDKLQADDLGELPYLGALLKDHRDLEEVQKE